jgi:hypothetical protein
MMDIEHVILGILGLASVIGMIAASLQLDKAYRDGKLYVRAGLVRVVPKPRKEK